VEADSNAASTCAKSDGASGIGPEKSTLPLSAMSTMPCSMTNVQASSRAVFDFGCGRYSDWFGGSAFSTLSVVWHSRWNDCRNMSFSVAVC
jgi:hypothetical protein